MPPPAETTHKPPRRELISRPEPAARQASALSGCLGLALAGLGVLGAIAFLLLLSSGLLAYALIVGGAFFAYAFFHYAIWGWWLGGLIRRNAIEEELNAVE